MVQLPLPVQVVSLPCTCALVSVGEVTALIVMLLVAVLDAVYICPKLGVLEDVKRTAIPSHWPEENGVPATAIVVPDVFCVREATVLVASWLPRTSRYPVDCTSTPVSEAVAADRGLSLNIVFFFSFKLPLPAPEGAPTELMQLAHVAGEALLLISIVMVPPCARAGVCSVPVSPAVPAITSLPFTSKLSPDESPTVVVPFLITKVSVAFAAATFIAF